MALHPMADRYERPGWVRRVNSMAEAVGASVAVPIDADALLEDAETAAGGEFRDLGDGDWEGRFRAIVAALEDNHLHVVGRLITREELARCLRTRLRLGALLDAEPSVADEAIVEPLAILGPARSGTTIVFEAVGLDPTLRTPVAADMLAIGSDMTPTERFLAAQCEQELWADIQPEFAAMHELRSDLPVECITLTAPSFAGNHWAMVLGAAGDWSVDIEADFAFHRLVLQAGQFGTPARSWVIKTPAYLMMFDQLAATYPDVRFIQTHRDPAKTMPSTLSVTAMIQWLRTDDVPLDGLAELIGALFGGALNTVAERRAAGTFPGPVGDLPFLDLVADPVMAVGAAYEQLGRELTESHAAAIADFAAAKPKGKFGTHRYTAADWGFDVEVLRSELAPYIEAFGVELEP